jgi:CBS domain-containing protein
VSRLLPAQRKDTSEMTANEKLSQVVDQLKAGHVPGPVTVRELLSWFEVKKRGSSIVPWVRETLESKGLLTQPDFDSIWIDGEISFALRTDHQPPLPDPTFRVGRLESANRKPISVVPDDTLQKAVTLMLSNDFSQLPVMTNERELKGVVSWTSVGSRLALGITCKTVRDCMEPAHEVQADLSLFAAIALIVKHDYVLVRDATRVVTGIVTTSDLSVQFQRLAEPFLLIGEIENYTRRMLRGKFTVQELAGARDPADTQRVIKGVADMTIAEYKRLVEKPDRWEKLKLSVDRTEFIRTLDRIREIRNDVMHFDPEEIHVDDLSTLRDFVRLFQTLAQIKVI